PISRAPRRRSSARPTNVLSSAGRLPGTPSRPIATPRPKPVPHAHKSAPVPSLTRTSHKPATSIPRATGNQPSPTSRPAPTPRPQPPPRRLPRAPRPAQPPGEPGASCCSEPPPAATRYRVCRMADPLELGRGQSLVVYHHADRTAAVEEQARRRLGDIAR